MGLPARSRARVCASGIGAPLLALFATGGPAVAAPKPISGKLSKPGYTVIALAGNGRATSVRARTGGFKLRPPAKRVTLHLRAPNGTYAGPVVVGRKKKGKRAVLGVRAGAKLGKIRVRFGHARLARRLRKKRIDARRLARAKKGIPIGARVFGRVPSQPLPRPVPGDLDADGIPEPLDIDDDGDLILDNLDRSPAGAGALAAQTGGCGPNNVYCPDVSSTLILSRETNVNVNAGSTPDQIDAAVSAHGVLRFSFPRGGPVEIDCAGDPQASRAGLRYCSTGGSGVLSAGTEAGRVEYPECCDSDGDGFGELGPLTATFLHPGAAARRPTLDASISQIGAGDPYLEHFATDGDASRCPPPQGETNPACLSTLSTLPYFFATVPALVSYSDTAGHSATVAYPTPPPVGNCGAPCNAPGTQGNGFLVGPGNDGNIWLRLTFWRPQRSAIPGDPPTATWMDVGLLTYGVVVQRPGVVLPCSQDSFQEDDPSTPLPPPEDDPYLTPATPHAFLQGGGFDDGKLDEPSSPGDTSPGRTFSYTLNLTTCLAGVPFGDELLLEFRGAPSGASSAASQNVRFRLQSSITVKKQTDPAESPTTGTEFPFHLVDSAGGVDFKLRHDSTRSFDFPAGNYTVQEFPTAGYDLTGITCDDSDSTGSTAQGQANFKLAGGEHVTCTFTNTKL
jgi:hypothetical protein